jgi:hypothetical protein
VRKLTLLAVLAVCPIIAHAGEWAHNYPVNGKPELVVDTNDADVEITVGAAQQVEARVITHGLKINNDLKITDTQNGNRVELQLHESKHVCFGFCSYGVRLELRVPREADLNIHTGDGNIRVDAVKGNLQLETGDGDVRLSDIEGILRTDTHDGNINVRGKLDVLDLRTGDGDIEAEVSALSAPQPGWMLRSGDGNITLRLPSDFRADIDAHTGDGRLDMDFPIATSVAGRENSIEGKINGGGIAVELRTGDGDIHVSKM